MRFEQLYPHKKTQEVEREKNEREPIDSEFSEQWKHPQKITTPLGETIDLYDMRPAAKKTPIPALMVSGYTGTAELWKKNMREFYARGRRSLVVDGSHGVAYGPDDRIEPRAKDAERRKIAAVFAALDGAQVEKADAVAYSKGCIDLVLAAYAYPERFRNVVLIEPAGMNSAETLGDVIVRNLMYDIPSLQRAHEAYKRGDPGYQWDIHADDSFDLDLSGEITGYPGKAAKEVLSIAHIRVVDLLRGLKEKGIGVVIVQSPEDEMFPGHEITGVPLTHVEAARQRLRQTGELPPDTSEVLAAAEEAGEPFVFDEHGKVVMDKPGALAREKQTSGEDIRNIVDGYYSVAGIHNRFFDQPVEYTQLVDGALTALAAKKGEV